jgi:hypothetical protein
VSPVVKFTLLAAAACCAVAVGGCGNSKEEKAIARICDSRADIERQVGTLKSLTPSNFTLERITGSLRSIQSDLASIRSAKSEVAPARRQQVQTAAATFDRAVRTAARQLGTSLSVDNVALKVRTAGRQLAAAYSTALQPIDCGGAR